jgi:hypothetical protein
MNTDAGRAFLALVTERGEASAGHVRLNRLSAVGYLGIARTP